MPFPLTEEAKALAKVLFRGGKRIVLAESCTAGLAAATLAKTPGISQFLCGSAVTYRETTKEAWLGVTKRDLKKHTAVSEPVARQMAAGVLKNTPDAEFAAAVTGHLGPDAPPGLDGVAFIAVARRRGGRAAVVSLDRVQLAAKTRRRRQQEAAARLLAALRQAILDSEK